MRKRKTFEKMTAILCDGCIKYNLGTFEEPSMVKIVRVDNVKKCDHYTNKKGEFVNLERRYGKS